MLRSALRWMIGLALSGSVWGIALAANQADEDEAFEQDQQETQQAQQDDESAEEDSFVRADRILIFSHKKPKARPEMLIYESIPTADSVSKTPVLTANVLDAESAKKLSDRKADQSGRGVRTKVKAHRKMIEEGDIGTLKKESQTADELGDSENEETSQNETENADQEEE